MAFAGILRQSTAIDILIGPFVDSTDGNTEETGLTISQADVRLSKNGQTAAQKNDATACAHDANGFYNCELDATDTNTVGQLTLFVHESGALMVRHDFQVLEEATYDRDYAASATGLVTLAAVTHTGATIPTVTTTGTATAVTTVNGLAANVITAAAINTGAFTAAKFAAGAFDAVWTVAVRVLTAATNLTTALATPTNITAGTITTVTNLTNAPTAGDLTATMKASVNTEVDTAIADAALATAANLAIVDTVVDTILVDTGTDGVVVAAASKTGYALSTAGVDAILDEVVEGTFTLRQMVRLVAAALLGELSGAATTTITIRDASDTKTRVTATVDADGNRSALTLDAT